MPNGSQPQIPDHAYDDNCDDSESLAPLIRATILFLVPVSPRHYRPFAFSLSIYFIFKGNALAIVALEPFVRSIPIGKTLGGGRGRQLPYLCRHKSKRSSLLPLKLPPSPMPFL
jgi:hypothetical protein